MIQGLRAGLVALFRSPRGEGAGTAPAWSGPRTAVLGALLVTAIAVRVWHIRVGLPDFVEEAIPFRRAFAMWGWESGEADLNPRFFTYPSLSLYLHHLLQQAHVAWGQMSGRFANPNDYFMSFQLDPTPMVVLARLLGVAADAATVAGVTVIGERIRRGAGWLAAGMVAFAPVMIQTSRAVQADPLMTAFAVWGLERTLAYRRRGGLGRLAGAVVAIGLAVGTKYTAGLLIVPLAWVLIERHGRRVIPFGATSLAGVGAILLLTSPFILAELPTFARDLAFVRQLPEAGHLGNLDQRAFMFHLVRLATDLGWVAPLLLGFSLASLVSRSPGRGEAVVLWLAMLSFAVPISLARIEAVRYLVPVIPIAAVLIGAAALSVSDRVGQNGRRPVRWVLAAALLLPVVVGGMGSAATGVDSTQLEARRWCELRLATDELLLQEAYGVQLPTRATLERGRGERPVRLSSAALRERYLARPAWRVVTLPLSVAGRCVNRVPVPGGPPVEVELFPSTADFNRIFYDPRLLVGVDYLLTSESVRARFEADTSRFAAAVRFYRAVEQVGEVAARFHSRAGVVGPAITIYRLGPRADSLILARYGRLEPFWWAASVPAAYRVKAHALLGLAPAPETTSVVDGEGRPAAWVSSLAEVFEERIRPFGSQMADELTSLDRCEAAMCFAAANLAMSPARLEDCLAYTACSGRLGNWVKGRSVVERALAATPAGAPEVPYLRLEHARILMQVGELRLAREELEWVIDVAGVDHALTTAARSGLESLE